MKKVIEKKKIVLTLSRTFPSWHRFLSGELTGFAEALRSGQKIHTIREDAKHLWSKKYEEIVSGRKYLSVREWTGKPYNSEQRELARYDEIGLQRVSMFRSVGDEPMLRVYVDDKEIPVEDVARNDGMDVEDFMEWFFHKGGPASFEGVIIHFTKFRY